MRHGPPWRETAETLAAFLPYLAAAALLVLGVLLISSCRTSPPAPRVLVLSEHCQTASPGDTVPPLPEGETRWWLCTPTGLRLMLPADSDIPDPPERGAP